MSLRRPVLVFIAAFILGGVIGYACFPSPTHKRTESGLGGERAEEVGKLAVSDERAREQRPARVRKKVPAIRLDENGRYLLPAELAERLDCMALNGMHVNRSELAILGFTDEELGQLEELVAEVCEKCFSREKAAVKDFTRGETELVLLIPGDPGFAESVRKDAEEGVRSIARGKTALIEARMMSELGSLTMDFGHFDYYQRVGRSESSANGLEIESIRISEPMTKGIAMPEPGDGFQDYKTKYRYGASRRYGYGGEIPEFLRHLITTEDCEALLPGK